MTEPNADRYAQTHREWVVPPAPSPVDLHTHTTRSDGVLAPADLVVAAREVGVRILAIADHDTLAGYRDVRVGNRDEARPSQDAAPVSQEGAVASQAAAPVTHEAALQLIPAVEINAIADGIPDLWEGELHILGYGMDPDDDAFEAALAAQRGRRASRFRATVERLREIGMPIDAEVSTLSTSTEDALGRPTIARCLVRAGFATSVEDAFRRLIGRGRPGYTPRTGLGPAEAIAAIRAARGLPVLAHFPDAPARQSLLRELQDFGLGGLEVYYRSFDRPTVEALRDVAAALALVPTGGSDYHGDTGTYAESHAQLWVPAEVGAVVLEKSREASRSE